MKRLCWCSLPWLAVACASSIPVTAPVTTHGQREPIEVAFSDDYNLVLVPARIPGIERELTMMVDTGAPMVLSTALAEELGLRARASNQLLDSAGAMLDAAPIEIPQLTVGDLELERLGGFAATLDFDLCLEIDGVLGSGWPRRSGFFDQTAVEIDYPRSRVRLAPSGEDLTPGGAVVPIRRGDPNTPGPQLYAQVAIEDHTIWALLDTGNAGPVYLPTAFFTEIGHRIDEPGALRSRGAVSSGATGKTLVGTQYETRLRSLRLGEVDLRGVAIAVEHADDPTQAGATRHPMLGNEFMSDFRVVVDVPAGIARFVLEPGRDPNTARASYGVGIRIAGGAVRVTAISDGGPASRAGLELDDEVVAVDGQPVHMTDRASLCAAQRAIKHATGPTLRIRTRRDDVDVDHELVLGPTLASLPPS